MMDLFKGYIMEPIKDLIKFVRKYSRKINFGKVYLYTLKEIDINCEHEHKYLEKRFLAKDICLDNIVDGRLTISIPGEVAINVSEIMLISE